MATIEPTVSTKEVGTTDASSVSRFAISRLLREPLLHFLLLGGGLFLLYSYLSDQVLLPSNERIVVTQGKIEHLATLFSRTWNRPPTRKELTGLIQDHIREEIAYRHGTSMGLDANDPIIRRRIRQKLDFVADDFASQLQPSDDQLQEYLRTHPDSFRSDARVSFQQVFFDPKRHGDELPQVVGDLIVRLLEDPSVKASEQGDRTLLASRYTDVSEHQVASTLGTHFASALVDVEPGVWQGPVESSFGLHAVFVESIQPGELPDLKAVKPSVRREWEHNRRQELTEQFYEGLLEQYEVVVEWPEEASE